MTNVAMLNLLLHHVYPIVTVHSQQQSPMTCLVMDNLILEYSTAACKKNSHCTKILCEYTSPKPPWITEMFSIHFYPCASQVTVNIVSKSSKLGTLLNLNLSSSHIIQPLGRNFGRYEITLNETKKGTEKGVLFGVS